MLLRKEVSDGEDSWRLSRYVSPWGEDGVRPCVCSPPRRFAVSSRPPASPCVQIARLLRLFRPRCLLSVRTRTAGSSAPIQVGGRWYARDYDDDDFDDDDYYPPAYYPPPPVRVYRVPPPPPVVVYEPPVYGWYYAPPPRPSSCGRYRYWNGDRCTDARYNPPYVGPRW